MEKNINVYNEDDVIIREGEQKPYMYYVISGAVSLYLNYQEKDEVILGICSAGKVFSEMGMLNNTPSLYTAVAFNNGTKILKITHDNFVEFIKEHPKNTIEILKNMAKINSMLTKNLELMSEELTDNAITKKRNADLKANIARYSVRGIDAYRVLQQ